jgi:hypothetical protein
MSPADRRPVAAVNVNTLGEVPNSSWFTNRIGSKAMTLEEIVRGPDRVAQIAIDDWVIVQGKDTGRQAGFRAISASDPTRQLYQVEFDPRNAPEMATGAEIIGTTIYHALGYNVVDIYLTDIDVSKVTIAPTATIEVNGKKRPFTQRDLDGILSRSARKADGRYRATASRFADGRNLGPFRYHGTRQDDPNDIYPHEHRRELRGNRVFAAWLNHDDSRAVNTLDMLVGAPGQQHVKHYMFDFGSILGSGTNEEDLPWVGHEYVVERKEALLTLVSLGLWRRPFIGVKAPSDLVAAGNFTSDGFVPEGWKPHYPNAAFVNLQRGDAFWAARIVAAFSPEAIAAIVGKARYSDPRVVDYITGTLLRRRELVLRAWLANQNPVADVRLENGRLSFVNAAEEARLTGEPSAYALSWFRFDNASGHRTYVAHATSGDPHGVVPGALAGSLYVGVDIRTSNPEHPAWTSLVRAYFRATGRGWEPVGLERGTEPSTALQASR